MDDIFLRYLLLYIHLFHRITYVFNSPVIFCQEGDWREGEIPVITESP